MKALSTCTVKILSGLRHASYYSSTDLVPGVRVLLVILDTSLAKCFSGDLLQLALIGK